MIIQRDRDFIRLIMRSPDEGQGWRKVSVAVWPLVEAFGRPELIEAEQAENGGGRVRLSSEGETVAEYLI